MAGSSSSDGYMTVTGDGSSWTVVGDLIVGDWGNGSLKILDGGTVTSEDSFIAHLTGSSGSSVVVGAGSRWIVSGELDIGFIEHGNLDIINGGVVGSSDSRIGNLFPASGSVNVRGMGSAWTASVIYVGFMGDGVLDISDNGLVLVSRAINVSTGSASNHVKMSTGGKLAIGGDFTSSLSDFMSEVKGTGDIRYWEESVWDWAHISGATPGEDFTLAYHTTGDLNGYTVLTVTTAPEPATMVMLALGGLAVLRRRRR